jgi:DnaJ family protein C protein 10
MELKAFYIPFLFALSASFVVCEHDELYKTLGVSTSATTREIRKAFKKLALDKHPDKNTDDPNANEVFMKINRAYEILKDDDLRKKYDQFGEDGLNNKNFGNFQNWNFYNQNFGIYDDDSEIVTLSRSDFMQSVEGSSELWFINFYSTMCSHCHELAPIWRQLAKELEGVVRIGAVNCMDDWQLCNQQQIGMFPLLIMYPKRQPYQQDKNLESLMQYALSFTSGTFFKLTSKKFDSVLTQKANKKWFISFCLLPSSESESADETCLEDNALKKISVMIDGHVNVGSVNCKLSQSVCDRLKPTSSNMYYQNLKALDDVQEEAVEIQGLNYKDVASVLMTFLPDLKMLESEAFEQILVDIKTKKSRPWLIHFVFNHDQKADHELRKLSSLMDGINAGRVDCQNLMEVCKRYSVTKYPTFVIFKVRDLYEHHYGRKTVHDIAKFAKDNAFTNLRNLRTDDFANIAKAEKPFFIDFFTPWCPPCMHLLPEFRKAAKKNGKNMNFGIVDCTVEHICNQYNIHSFPTSIIFNKSTQHHFRGEHTVNDLNVFIEDFFDPIVYTLNYESFRESVTKRAKGKIWLVDFYAGWCGPCKQMAPEWRALAKKLKGIAFVAKVDCQLEPSLCSEQNVQMYPQIRLYAADSTGSAPYHLYDYNQPRNSDSFYRWAEKFAPNKKFKRVEF